MAGNVSSGAEYVSPDEREARWRLFVRFAIEAASESEAGAVLAQALTGLEPELALRSEPVVRPRHIRVPDDMWVAELAPDLTRLQEFSPDDARTRCRFVQGSFPEGVLWSLSKDTEREARSEWPPGIWERLPGRDDLLLHPAVRAVMISCQPSSA